jgi:phage baseplate assembly protein gpV
MSMGLFDTVRRVAGEELKRLRTAELAVVTEIHPTDPANYACTVELRDSGIVLKHAPVATHKLGAVAIPAVGDLVLVQFVGGDIDAPVILGSLYNDEDRPPESADGQCVLHLPLGADDDDAAHIEVSSLDKRVLIVRMGSTEVTIQDDDPAVKIDVGGNASLTIGSNGAIKIQSSGNIEMKADGNIKVEAAGKLELKGATVDIN